MASEWFDTTIGEQATLQRGIDITKAEQRPGSIPVVSSGGISSYHDSAAVSGPGVILGRKGVVGSVYYVANDYWPHDTTLWVKDFHGNDPRFVYYFFRWMAPRIALMDVGSANPTLNRNHVHPIEIHWPPYVEQRAISHILGALDDKIALNHESNRTLDSLLTAIFDSWFVAFEPIRIKAEGGNIGLAPDMAALFPAAFDDSELGEIPHGWKVKAVDDLAHVVGGSTPRTTEESFWENGLHAWATPKDLSRLSVPVLLETERRITDLGLQQISSGLLPIGTVLLSSRAPIGYLAIAEIPIAINQGFIAMKAREKVSNLFLLLWARSAHDEILSRANGSTFLEISKANFRPIKLVTPPSDVFAAFDRIARPLYERIVSNERETGVLSELRDTLLPNLLSGHLRVSAAERIAARCL